MAAATVDEEDLALAVKARASSPELESRRIPKVLGL